MGQISSKNQMRNRSKRMGSVDSVEEEDVRTLPYFYADLSRDQAQAVMRSHARKPGSFLMRYGNRAKCYAITLVVAENVIGHVVVFSPNDKCFYAVSEAQFESMSDLVKYYQNNPLPNAKNDAISTNVRLRIPVLRFRPPKPYPYQKDKIIYDTNCSSNKQRTYDFVNERERNWRQNHQLSGKRRFAVFEDENNQLVCLPYPAPKPPTDDTSEKVGGATTPKQRRKTQVFGNRKFSSSPSSDFQLHVTPATRPKTLGADDGFDQFSPTDNTVPKELFESKIHSSFLNNRRNVTVSNPNNLYLQPLKNNLKFNEPISTNPKELFEADIYHPTPPDDHSSDVYLSMDPAPPLEFH